MMRMQPLVASSDAARRDALAGILVHCGLRPLIAISVNGVRTAFALGRVHLVFCEDELPGGGFRAVMQLASAAAPAAPVIVCSRCGDLAQYLEAMEMGAFDFIAPPYRLSEVRFILGRIAETVLSKTRSTRSSRDAHKECVGEGAVRA